MAQGRGVASKLAWNTLQQLELVSKSTWIDVIVELARTELGHGDELQLLGLVDQWLEPVCRLRKMKPPLLQAHAQRALIERRMEQTAAAKERRKPKRQVSLKPTKE